MPDLSAGRAVKMADTPTMGRLPWHRSITGAHLSSGGALRGIASEDGLNVAWVTLGVLGAEDRLAFIVRACNSHSDLVEALKHVDRVLSENLGHTLLADIVRAA